MLRVEDLTLKIGRKTLLHDISLQANAGEVTALIGPSGAGKSSFLKALSGDLPYSGRIVLNGRDIAGSHPAEMARIRAVLPQASALSFPFTVLEVARLGLQTPDPGHDLPQRMLARVGLAGFEGRFYQDLSGGEQQRVQLARVLAQVWLPADQPRWLFLDEPVSSLDIAHQITVMQIAREFAAGGGGVVMVMHDLNLSTMFADRIALMQQGRIVVCDRPARVMEDGMLAQVYGCALRVNMAPADALFVLPQSIIAPTPS